MNDNLARNFQRMLARREIENVSPAQFEKLKQLALEMFDQNCVLQEMAERVMKESLVGIDFSNMG